MADGIYITSLLIVFLLMTGIYKNLKKPGRAVLFSAASGTAGLVFVNLLGIQIAVNFYTLFFSIIMGLPGVITMLILKLIFKII